MSSSTSVWGLASRFRFEARGSSDWSVGVLVSDSVEGRSLSFAVLDRFLRLLVSVSVDCGVGVGRAFILDAEARLG